MSIILKNATFVDYKTFEIKETNILISDNQNTNIEFVTDSVVNHNAKGATIIDCKNKIVTKSLVCGHHHAYSALARGMGGPLKTPTNFHENLKFLWWALDKSLDVESVKASAYATAIACVKNGITFVIDHHASPYFVEGSLEIIAEAFEEVGISHLLCYEISDRDGSEIAEKGLAATQNYLKYRQGLVGLHASFTVNDNTLAKAVALAQKFDSGIHIHTAEDVCDQNECLSTYNKRVVERLHGAGVLNFSKSILVHCLHLSERERELIKKSPVFVAQNIESNLNNNVGIFKGNGLNNNIMLGTDGMHSNMLRSLKAAYIYGQTSEQIGMMDAYNRLRNTHRYIEENNFNGDGDNNLVVIDYKSPTPLTSDNFLGHLIFGIDSSDITHVIANGKLILNDRELTKVNEEKILAFTQEASERLWKKYKSQHI